MGVDEVLEESRQKKGAMGALAYVVLRGLAEGGAAPDFVKSLEQNMQICFSKLSDEQANVLCQVAELRLEEAKDDQGRWY